jgi:hypothetical protein
MALFLVEREFAEQLLLNKEMIEGAVAVNVEEDVRWMFSFLSADKKKSYCLFEAPNPEAIMTASARLGMPANAITPVDEVRPEAFA